MHHSLRRPQSVPSFVRPLMASLALAFVAVVGQAAPVADVHALAQKEQQPLLDTLRDLVHIESGSKDIEGLNQIAERIASQLKQLGGTVDVLQTSDIYRLDFLGLGKEADERAIENGLVRHVTEFLLELGSPRFQCNK